MDINALLNQLKKKAPGAVLERAKFGRSNQITLWIEMGKILGLAEVLSGDPEFAIDWVENLSVMQMDEVFVLSYFLRSTRKPSSLILRGSVVPPSPDAVIEVPSVSPAWPMVSRMESEIEELFGIHFKAPTNEESPVRIRFLPDGWEGFPLRKKYQFPKEILGVMHARPVLQKHQEGAPL